MRVVFVGGPLFETNPHGQMFPVVRSQGFAAEAAGSWCIAGTVCIVGLADWLILVCDAFLHFKVC